MEHMHSTVYCTFVCSTKTTADWILDCQNKSTNLHGHSSASPEEEQNSRSFSHLGVKVMMKEWEDDSYIAVQDPD
jgi:hypothetical protein